MTFSSFFQGDSEADLIEQVEWVEEKLGLSDSFFSKMLEVEEDLFANWRIGNGTIPNGTIPVDKQDCLREFWQAITHILSFLNYDLTGVLTMLEHKSNSEVGSVKLATAPPWTGSSLKTYLETHGLRGIQTVSAWMQSVRFADSF